MALYPCFTREAAVGLYYGIHVALSMVTGFIMAMGAFSGADGKVWMMRYFGGMALLMASASLQDLMDTTRFLRLVS